MYYITQAFECNKLHNGMKLCRVLWQPVPWNGNRKETNPGAQLRV